MRAILVSVDYADLLAVTLPYNRHHFDDVMVVTTPASQDGAVAVAHECRVHYTDAFYDAGASFNKWKALEEGLDAFGRHGWLCLMDADVLWPKELPDFRLEDGCLYTPMRRMCEHPELGIPPEDMWGKFSLHRQQQEFAGYSQIFYASDPVLGSPPWHQVDWKHAGGADSFFQQKWPDNRKVRPPFEVLHLGPAGQNWYGRATPLLDGSTPPDAAEKLAKVAATWRNRRGKHGEERFQGEKL
jgi:hypothetical protein